jgi:hypothetical protein
MRSANPRGSALIMTIVVLLIVAVIGVGIVRFATREVAGASAGQRSEALVACAEAGRQLILSRFRAVGTPPTQLTVLDEAIASNMRVVGGHYDTNNVQVSQVVYLPDAAFGVDRGAVQTLTNRIVVTGGGAKPMRAIVHCQMDGYTNGQPDSGRQLEVEFGLRFGI